MSTPFRIPLGARLLVLVALAGFATILVDPRGLGAAPVVQIVTGLFGLAGVAWVIFAAVTARRGG